MIAMPVSDLYRVGNHQPQNVYRGDQYIGVMFSAEDAASVVQMLNLHECLACPPSCGSCSHDPDCECYEHQNDHPGNEDAASTWSPTAEVLVHAFKARGQTVCGDLGIQASTDSERVTCPTCNASRAET